MPTKTEYLLFCNASQELLRGNSHLGGADFLIDHSAEFCRLHTKLSESIRKRQQRKFLLCHITAVSVQNAPIRMAMRYHPLGHRCFFAFVPGGM